MAPWGGRPPFDLLMMFKALILKAQHNLSDARMEFMVRHRLSWLHFLRLSLGHRTPDENMIRHFRNRPDELKGCAGHPWGLDAQDDRKVRYRTDSTPSASTVVRWTTVEAFAGLQL